MEVAFAFRSGVPLSEVRQWHPRDLDTWLSLAAEQKREAEEADQQQASEQRFAARRAEVIRQMQGRR